MIRPMLHLFICTLCLATASLEAGEYSKDWQAFEKEVEKSYPFFKEKGIAGDWKKAKPALRAKADACTDDSSFMQLVDEALRLMRDGHAQIIKSRAPQEELKPMYGLPVAFRPASGGKVIVASAAGPVGRILTPGTVIAKIDGIDARQALDKRAGESWKAGGYFSSPQRAAFLEYGMPLRSTETTDHTLTCHMPGTGELRAIPVRNDYARRLPVYHLPKNLARAAGSCAHALLPGGAGYVYLRRIQGDETAQGIEEALNKYPNVPGWVIDLRGNGGGGYTKQLDTALKKLVAGRAAVIIDAGCFSAGETFARDLKKEGGNKVILLGAVTAGSSSSKKDWDFPSGIASIRFSVASRKGIKGKPIEFYGVVPDIAVEAEPEDITGGLDTEIIKAEQHVLGKRA